MLTLLWWDSAYCQFYPCSIMITSKRQVHQTLFVQDFDRLWSSIFIPRVWPSTVHSKESEWDHVASEVTWLPHFPASVHHSQPLHCFLWREVDCFCVLWNETVLKLGDILYFMFPKSVHILLEINFNAFYAFWGYFIFFFTFHKLLEPNAFHIDNEILR